MANPQHLDSLNSRIIILTIIVNEEASNRVQESQIDGERTY